VDLQHWQALAAALIRGHLNRLLQDELLAAEARASLKPQEKSVLAYLVREQTQSLRRERGGGSQAELERQLRSDNQNEQRFAKDFEYDLLIQHQIQDKFRARLKTSWKDVRLYFERNPQIFQPPMKATFRRIQVTEENAPAVETIRKALAGGTAFAQAASMPENEYDPAHGGLARDIEFKGTIQQGTFFRSEAWNEAARKLSPGSYTLEPVPGTNAAGKPTLNWIFLESILDTSKSLNDPEVQLRIAKQLDDEALNAALNAYFTKLKTRASFTDIDTMTELLVNLATQRYWMGGS
jgi:hypothetical protein